MQYDFYGSVNAQLALHIARHMATRYAVPGDFCLGESKGEDKTLVFYAAATDFADTKAAKEYFNSTLTKLNSGEYKRAVISVDNPMGAALATAAQIPTTRVTSVYGQNADWYGAITRNQLSGVSLVSQGPDGGYFRAYAAGFGQVLAGAVQTAVVLMIDAGVEISQVKEIATTQGFLSPVMDGVWLSAVTDATHLTQMLDEVCELVEDLTVCVSVSFGADDYLFGAMLAGACNRIILIGADPESQIIAGAQASGARCEIVLADTLQEGLNAVSDDLFMECATVCLIPAEDGDVRVAGEAMTNEILRVTGGGNL